MPFLSSRARVILTAGVALGFPIYQLTSIAVADYADQAANAPRPLPTYNSGNPEGYNTARPFRDYGPPGWAGVNRPIDPPLYDEEFRSHFGFAAHLIFEVLDVLQLPATPGHLGQATFPYRFDANGTPERWIEPVHALSILMSPDTWEYDYTNAVFFWAISRLLIRGVNSSFDMDKLQVDPT